MRKPNALTLGLALLMSSSIWAEQKVEFEGYELHYIVLNTTELTPNIAEHYDIARSGKRAFINLSVLKQTDDGYGRPVPVEISALQRTLLGQQVDIDLKEIREGSAIYYIGTFQIINREVLWFDIDLSVSDGPEFSYSFSQKVWQE